MRAKLITGLLLFLTVGFLISAFAVQNLNQGVMLELNLGFTRLVTKEPLPAPWLLYGTFFAGALLGMTMTMGRVFSAARRIRDLELQLSSHSSRRDDW